jgi:tRNA-binding EMAP/Myf-like protein
MINWDDFKIDMRVGTIIEVNDFPKQKASLSAKN